MSKSSKINKTIVSTGNETHVRKHPPRTWIIPNILTHGLVAMSAREKTGKSDFWRCVAIQIAMGERVLGVGDPVEPGDVVYIDYENGDEENQLKQHMMFPGNQPDLGRLSYVYTEARFDDGLFEIIEGWRTQSERPALVVIDVYNKARTLRRPKGVMPNDLDDMTLMDLQRWSHEHRICVVIILHNKRGPIDAGDILGSVGGSTALTRTPDIVMIMIRDKRTNTTTLHATGRKLSSDQNVVLEYDNGWLRLIGDVEKVAKSSQRRAIVAAIQKHGRMGSSDIAAVCEMKNGAARKLILSMKTDGELIEFNESKYPTYGLPDGSGKSAVIGNNNNTKSNEYNGKDEDITVTDVVSEHDDGGNGNDEYSHPIVTDTLTENEPITDTVTVESSVNTKDYISTVTDIDKKTTPFIGSDMDINEAVDVTVTDFPPNAFRLLESLINSQRPVEYRRVFKTLGKFMNAAEIKEATDWLLDSQFITVTKIDEEKDTLNNNIYDVTPTGNAAYHQAIHDPNQTDLMDLLST